MKNIMMGILLYGLGLCTGCFAAEVEPVKIESMRTITIFREGWKEDKNILRIFFRKKNKSSFYEPCAYVMNESGKRIATFSNFEQYHDLYRPGTYHYPSGPFLDDEQYFQVTGFGSSERLVITAANRKEFHIAEVQHTDQPEALLEYSHAHLFMYGETAALTSNLISKTEIYDQEIIRLMRTALYKSQPLLITFKKNRMSPFTVKVLVYQHKASRQWDGWYARTISEDLLHRSIKVDFFSDPAAITIDLNKNERDGSIYRRNKYICKFILSIGLVAVISWSIKEFCDSLKAIKL